MIQTAIKAQEEKNIAPDDVGAGAASIVFGGEDGVAISFEGDLALSDVGGAVFLGAAAAPPEKNDAIDLCM